MSCDNCPGTVWFDHNRKVWKHGATRAEVTLCRKPAPYFTRERPADDPTRIQCS